ncbi:MAG: TrmB family transcriptional regulator, partial [Myxococcales bacterium]
METLVALGFTGLEAEVYAALVEEAPATAYRIAQVIGKAAANVYKAVESLERRGVIAVDDGDSRRLRAVAPVELLARVERDFERAHGRAQRALTRLRSAGDDERVYSLPEREQVIERARAMLLRAEQLALVDVFPEPLEELR